MTEKKTLTNPWEVAAKQLAYLTQEIDNRKESKRICNEQLKDRKNNLEIKIKALRQDIVTGQTDLFPRTFIVPINKDTDIDGLAQALIENGVDLPEDDDEITFDPDPVADKIEKNLKDQGHDVKVTASKKDDFEIVQDLTGDQEKRTVRRDRPKKSKKPIVEKQ